MGVSYEPGRIDKSCFFCMVTKIFKLFFETSQFLPHFLPWMPRRLEEIWKRDHLNYEKTGSNTTCQMKMEKLYISLIAKFCSYNLFYVVYLQIGQLIKCQEFNVKTQSMEKNPDEEGFDEKLNFDILWNIEMLHVKCKQLLISRTEVWWKNLVGKNWMAPTICSSEELKCYLWKHFFQDHFSKPQSFCCCKPS